MSISLNLSGEWHGKFDNKFNRMSVNAGVVKLIILLDLVQDVELGLPVIEGLCKDRRFNVAVIISDRLSTRATWLESHLLSKHVDVYIVEQRNVQNGCLDLGYAEIDALMVIAESNAKAHKPAHRLVAYANGRGLPTYSIQHGVENIGLTYFDRTHAPERVKISSEYIFIWGRMAGLDRRISKSIRDKCIEVGTPKAVEPMFPLEACFEKGRAIVSVFENMHWRRYGNCYRKKFIANFFSVAEERRDDLFIFKSHQAGQWYNNSKYKNKIIPPNIMLPDQNIRKWSKYTALSYIAGSDCAITTPSTVALDCARINKPVAVVSDGMKMDRYAPLTLIDSRDSWLEYLESALSPGGEIYSKRNDDYVKRTLVENGSAISRMADSICSKVRNMKV